MFYNCGPQSAGPDRSDPWHRPRTPNSIPTPTSRSSTGRRAPDDLVERAVELGLTGLAVTDHNGLYGAVRFVSAAEAAGLHPVIGLEIELLDPAVADPDRDRRPATAPRQRRPRAVGGADGRDDPRSRRP